MPLLFILFFITAILYASIGFGGGSTYTALLVLFKIDYASIPIISLSCNLIVVSASTYFYFKHRLINKALIISLIMFSIPMSYFGGRLVIDEQNFIITLGFSLLVAAILMLSNNPHDLIETDKDININSTTTAYWKIGLVFGAPIGLLAGITGIGGGIFLAPLLHLFKIAKAQTVAATCSLFILVNSLAGLIGQMNKHALNLFMLEDLKKLTLLPIIVLLGGLIGNQLAIKLISPVQLRKLTALLILIVAIRLLLPWFST